VKSFAACWNDTKYAHAARIRPGRVGIRTRAPAVNVHVNLQGRETTGVVPPTQYSALVTQIANALSGATDLNPTYNANHAALFTHVRSRNTLCGKPGFCTDDNIGQDTGDVLALMAEGYNFDGVQNVTRVGDVAGATNPYSVPNFYGAHGHDSNGKSMSAIFFAAGPDVKQGTKVRTVRNIDVAPTILDLLGVAPAQTVDGDSLTKMLKR